MLSLDDATSFLASIDVSYSEQRLKDDPLGLLSEIIPSLHYNEPFQNVSMLAKPLSDRKRPTWPEVKEDLMAKRGGLCYSLNIFMKSLLEAIGFSVYYVAGSIVNDNNHLAMVVEIQSKKYLVDAGIAYPSFEPVPLDFNEESSIYHHSFLQYKFVRESANVISRVHKKSRGFDSEMFKEDEAWKKVCGFDLTPRDISFFDESMSAIYQVPGMSPFHNSLRIILYSKSGTKAFKDLLYFVEDTETHVLTVKEEMADLGEVIAKIKVICPLLSDAASAITEIPGMGDKDIKKFL